MTLLGVIIVTMTLDKMTIITMTIIIMALDRMATVKMTLDPVKMLLDRLAK
jgi:hypothetical protein